MINPYESPQTLKCTEKDGYTAIDWLISLLISLSLFFIYPVTATIFTILIIKGGVSKKEAITVITISIFVSVMWCFNMYNIINESVNFYEIYIGTVD